MADVLGGTTRQEIVDVIRRARTRWRTRQLLRGGIIVVGGGLVALGLASWGLRALKFSPASIIGFRVALFALLAVLVARWFVRPLRRRVTDMQVALYIEEHEPSLQAAILSAVDAGATDAPVSIPVPPVILERLIAQAIEKCRVNTVREVGQSAVDVRGVDDPILCCRLGWSRWSCSPRRQDCGRWPRSTYRSSPTRARTAG